MGGTSSKDDELAKRATLKADGKNSVFAYV